MKNAEKASEAAQSQVHARYKPGTSQVIGRGLGGASQVHAWYMGGTCDIQAIYKSGTGDVRSHPPRVLVLFSSGALRGATATPPSLGLVLTAQD